MLRHIFIPLILFACQISLVAQIASYQIVPPTEEGNCEDGMISISISPENGPYQYFWTSQNFNGTLTGNSIDNLSPGEYFLLVIDSNCGEYTESFDLLDCCTGPPSFNVQNSCGGDNNGAISFTILNQSSLDCNVTLKDINGNHIQIDIIDGVENLSAGQYVLEFDCPGGSACDFIYTMRILNSEVEIDIIELTNPTANDWQNGVISILATQSSGYVTYNWFANTGCQNPGGTGFSNSNTIENLGSGEYLCVIENEDGCKTEKCFRLEYCYEPGHPNYEPIYEPITYEETTTYVTNSGDCNGALAFDFSLGGFVYYILTGPNSYKISGALNTNASNPSIEFENLCEGEYTLDLDNGCEDLTETYVIRSCSEVEIFPDATIFNTCEGYARGEIILNPSGSEGPYLISWSNNQSGANINNLQRGNYNCTITDRFSCEKVFGFFIDDNIDPDLEGQTYPCGTKVICRGAQVDFLDSEPVCGFERCTERVCRCPANEFAEITQMTEDWGHTSERVNYSTCNLEGRCRDGTGWEVISFGTSKDFFIGFIPDPSCSGCIAACRMVSGCAIFTPSQGQIVNYVHPNAQSFNATFEPIPTSQPCGFGGCVWQLTCNGEIIATQCSSCPEFNGDLVYEQSSGYEDCKYNTAFLFTNFFVEGLDEDELFALPKFFSFNDLLPFDFSRFQKEQETGIYEIDPTNVFSYSELKEMSTLECEKINNLVDNNISITVLSNPFHYDVHLSITTLIEQRISIRLLDISGKENYFESLTLNEGNNQIKLGGSRNLNDGVYYLNVLEETSGISKVIKVVKISPSKVGN